MATKQRLPAEVRKKEIREAAKRVFLKKGFTATTMEDVIAEAGMSKGGVYRHYKSTSAMLYDLMVDGNYYYFSFFDDFIKDSNLKMKEMKDLMVEASVLKMIDENEYKSLYTIFLIESQKNSKLKELRFEIKKKGKQEFYEFLKRHNMEKLNCLANDDFIAFMESIMVANEILDVRDIFLNNKDFFRNIIYQYIETKQND